MSNTMHDPFNRSKMPASFDREGRVRLLGEAFKAMLDGKPLSQEAAMFLGGAGLSWLENGGSFEKVYLQVVRPKSHRTPSAIWREIAHANERQDGDGLA